MQQNIKLIVKEYLDVFSKEKDKLLLLDNFLKKSSKEELINWNNINVHLTVGAFIYSLKEDKFLVLYHKDLKMYLYPGGYIEKEDKILLDSALRELKEETGLEKVKLLKINNMTLPFDIDIHLIPFNERVGMPTHYHFDFRYLFLVDSITEIINEKVVTKIEKFFEENMI